ncbi:MAG: ATPase, T2SS/T4P/T4SS family [Acidobacteriota bacterium]
MARYAELFDLRKTDVAGDDASSPPLVPESGPKTFTLLFVDDEPQMLSGLRRVFHRENYKILTATSGQEALELMEAHPVQLILTDHRMPGMLGCELLTRIKQRWPETIRIMLTGHADVQAIMGAVNEGAVYKFMTKPCDDHDLRLTIALALEQYALLQENKQLKEITKQQHKKIKKYSSVFDEARGILGTVLVRGGVLTKEQLEEAMKARNEDEYLGDVLVRLGYSSEAEIAREMQKSQKLEGIDLKEVRISRNMADLLPRELCEHNRLIPIKLEGNKLTVAMADPSDILKIDNIAMWTRLTVIPVVAKASDILLQIKEVYGEKSEEEEVATLFEFEPIEEIDVVLEEDAADVNVEELVRTSGFAPIVRIVNAIISEALRNGASDIHIEPRTKHSVVRYRTDGMLRTKIKIPLFSHPRAVSRIKILAKMDLAERRRPQDGRFTVKAGMKIADIRVSTMPTINGEKVVMRILDKGASVKQASELGMNDGDLRRLESVIARPQGMVLSTGPTGSGKTTTLYSTLHEILHPARNYETIEDPVEYFLEEANQVHVRESIGLSFGAVLRATLRQDPDVILVGEIRDLDTADAAFKAAQTGHFVLSTLHTNNSVASITRLIDLGVKPYLIASALVGIIAQRLVRKICRHCKATALPDKNVVRLLQLKGFTTKDLAMGKGCARCNNTGYMGRTGLFEIFLMTKEFGQRISGSFREGEIMTLARADGMTTLREDGLEKVRQGITTLEELLRVLGPPPGQKRPCAHCGRILDATFSYCPHCGTYGRKICRRCDMPLEDEWKLCPSCGSTKNGCEVSASVGEAHKAALL